MHAKKLREWFVEVKLCFVRANTYLNILNFLMIALIFFSTTLWEYAPIQAIFPDKKMFLITGFIFIIIIVALIGYLDTKFKLWRTESEKCLSPERSPQMVVEAFQSAKMLNELKKQGKDTKQLEENLNELFARCQLSKEFELFKQKTS